MKKFLLLLPLLALPQFALACGLFEFKSVSFLDAAIIATLSSLAAIWFSIFWKNNFIKSPRQIFLLSVSRGVLWLIIIITFILLILNILISTTCLPNPQEDYFVYELPLLVLVISTIFFFLQNKWPTNFRYKAFVWSFFFGILALLYAYGITLPTGIPIL